MKRCAGTLAAFSGLGPLVSLVVLLLGLFGPASAASASTSSSSPEEASGPAELRTDERGALLGPFSGELPTGASVVQGEAVDRALGSLAVGANAIAAEAFAALYAETSWPEMAYNAGLSWYRAGRFDRALTYSTPALTSQPGVLRVQYLHAVLLQTVGRYADALALMGRAMESADASGLPIHRAISRLNIGTSARLTGDVDRSKAAFLAAQQIGDEAKLPGVVAAALLGRGRVLLMMGDREGAEDLWAQARKLGKRSGFGAAEADSLFSQASLAQASGRETQAARLVERGLEEAASVEDRSVRASLLLTAAELRWRQGQEDAALELISQADEGFAAAGVEVGQGHCAQLLGAWARDAGDRAVASAQLDRALKIQDRYQVPLARAETLRHLALLRADEGDFLAAVRHTDEALATFEQARAAELERGVRVARADIFWRAGEVARARAEAERALDLARLSEDSVAERQILVEVAILTAAMGDSGGARELFESIPTPARGKLSLERRLRFGVQLAESLRRAGEVKAALAEADVSLGLARQLGDPELLLQAQQTRAMSLADLGRAEEALAFLQAEGVTDGSFAEDIQGRRAIQRYNEGVRALQASDYEGAIERFEGLVADELVSPERRETARETLGSALALAGQDAQARGALETAQSYWTRALTLAEGRGAPAEQAQLQLRLAALRSSVEDPVGAVEFARSAARSAAAAGDRRLEGEASMLAGDFQFETDPAAARRFYEAALAAWGEDEAQGGRRANVTFNLGALLAGDGEVEAAKTRFLEARSLAARAGLSNLVERVDALLPQLESPE